MARRRSFRGYDARPVPLAALRDSLFAGFAILGFAETGVPGDPALSAMSFRMHTLEGTRMPKIGSSVVDPAGTQLVDDWITSLPASACPPQPQQ